VKWAPWERRGSAEVKKGVDWRESETSNALGYSKKSYVDPDLCFRDQIPPPTGDRQMQLADQNIAVFEEEGSPRKEEKVT